MSPLSGEQIVSIMGGCAFVFIVGSVIWGYVLMERSRHAALVELARLAAEGSRQNQAASEAAEEL